MDPEEVPAALRERLGPDATGGLIQLFDRVRQEWREDVIAACAERFERRVVEEISKLRVDMSRVESSLRQALSNVESAIRQDMTKLESAIRQDMAKMESAIRQDMGEMGSAIRHDMGEMGSAIRQDMAKMESAIRQDIADGRFEILKWCFLFWIGQAFVVTGIVGVMLRLYRP